MKNTQHTLHDEPNHNPSAVADKSAVRQTFKLGLDVDPHQLVTAIQCDHGEIKPAQKFSRARLVDGVREQVAAGWPAARRCSWSDRSASDGGSCVSWGAGHPRRFPPVRPDLVGSRHVMLE